jgi:GntR family transcriptional regulator, transcriptional repressor for pyruvate dehydrogenase complex
VRSWIDAGEAGRAAKAADAPAFDSGAGLSDNIQMTGRVLKLNVSPLPVLNRVEEVARKLVSRIRSGELQPDMRLPSEQMMAVQFGVSRTVIREAIARLKNEGLVTTRQGSGAFVRDWESSSLHLDPEISKSLKSVLFIAELRKGIEAEAAALAAERRTRKELVAIDKAYARVSETTRARGDSARADMGFHRAIADASHNPYYAAILDYLSQFLVQALRVSRGNEALREDFARQVESEHLDIVDAIRRKDSSAARLAAQVHMDQARIRIRKAGRDILSKKGKRLMEELIPPSLLMTPPKINRRDK